MHLYNAWLPPPVAEKCKDEEASFLLVVNSVRNSWRPDYPDSVYSTIKWISIIDLYLRAKSTISLEDAKALMEIGLDIFFASNGKLYVQVRWGNILIKLLKKYRKDICLRVPWRPFYDTLMSTHFTRNPGAEGWRLRQRHFETITSLVRFCRVLFPSGSAAEIWTEFSPFLENPWHNSSFEGSGFLNLFLPTNPENQDYFSNDFIKTCLDLWALVPNCHFWDLQWADLIARCIKNYSTIDWEGFLPILFTRYLNMFEVPVANGNGVYPFSLDAPRNARFLFFNRVSNPTKAIAKSIVYLLKPCGSTQVYFGKLANLLEQFYHPSNGGRWTHSLERLLRYLVIIFKRRLLHEQKSLVKGESSEIFLGKSERAAFVKIVLQFVDRAQYSKNESLAESAAAASSSLSYIEPTLVLPSMISRFHMALETLTATHQLRTAVTAVAYVGRALFLSKISASSIIADDVNSISADAYGGLLAACLSNALLGMDANDPPKTLATMQLIGSIFSNLAILDDDENLPAFLPNINFSEWLDEFLCRLFSMLLHLEPSSTTSEGVHTSSSGTFLVDDGPYYFCMLEILLGRLSKPLYKQALKKIAKFIRTNILPGAVAEVGLLCCATIQSNPEEAASQLMDPILTSIASSLEGTPVSGFGGGSSNMLFSTKATLPPALETAVEYQLKILAVAISYGGPVLLKYKEQLKETIKSAFNAPSWKVNGAGDHVLRSLLGSLVLYYPMDQYRCIACHPAAGALEEWASTKDSLNEQLLQAPKWHIPNDDEVSFANELLDLHLRSPLDDLLAICQSKNRSDLGLEKERLKVTLLRIDSSLQGVQSCLPDFHPSIRSGSKDQDLSFPFVVGESGASVGSPELREKAAEIVHIACKYLLEARSDDSILLILLIRIMDALGNFGSIEYDEWSNHRHAWKLDSAAIIEPPVNFLVSSFAKGKKRPRWALIDKAYMHNTWRSSQSSYHLFRINSSLSPSEHLCSLMGDLLSLSLHNYETVRILAGKSLSRIFKRSPFLVVKCVPTLTKCLRDSSTPEHAVLGACAILSTRTVLRQLTLDSNAFSSFLLGILGSSHHESLKAQKAINELFVKYNIQFSGLSKTIYSTLEDTSDGLSFEDLISKISSMSFDLNGIHWRYSLMANRVLLLLVTASKSVNLSPKVWSETAGHFLKSLRSQVPPTRMLAISALNVLLQESPHRLSQEKKLTGGNLKSPLEDALIQVFSETGFFEETLNYLSHDHIIPDSEGASSRRNRGTISNAIDKSITRFYFDFAASWPRTPTWISMIGGDNFYASFARIFKRLVQECGSPVILALQSSLEESSVAKERAKQCVAAEVLAGVLHSDVGGLSESWDSWIMSLVQKIIVNPTVESTPDWAASIRYAVTGKGKYGIKMPILRDRILDCLVKPLPHIVSTNIVAKRFSFLAAALIEISPPRMKDVEVKFHGTLLSELIDCMNFSSAQVREAIGVTLSVLCSNIRLLTAFRHMHSQESSEQIATYSIGDTSWDHHLIKRASELAANIQNTNQSLSLDPQTELTLENGHENDVVKDDIKWMETLFHFIISSMKSGRSPFLADIIVGVMYPIISLQETSSKDLSILAKAAFELLKWHIIPQPDLGKAVSLLISSSNDSNWRTRFATLTYLHSFMYRHTFLLSAVDKRQIWTQIEKLLKDSQVEVRERAATVLAGLMKGGDEDLANEFRDRAFREALSLYKKRRLRNSGLDVPAAFMHGSVLALVASVLSVPYDMPSWLPDTVTLLARFIGEPSPIKSTVTKAVAEFRRTHADTWIIQKDSFTEEQLEILVDTSSSSSYFA
ncbi:proteasome activator subunit 4 isoform X1 [Nymphaea colorata]|nr:proteasome activator subunit 4 isoform X1 [Nymphaea colorata]